MITPHFARNAMYQGLTSARRLLCQPQSVQNESLRSSVRTQNRNHRRQHSVFTAFSLLMLLVFAVLPVRAQSVGDGVQLATINDWGSGFIATFDYEVRAEDSPLTDWTFDLGYSGPAMLVNTWMTG